MLRRKIKGLVGQQSVNDFKFLRAKAFETFGINAFSYPAFFAIDRVLIKLFNYKKDGRFIEVGANDGFAQSNTYALERFYDWQGILIEPIPRLFERCRRFRPEALVFNCALGRAANGDYTAASSVKMVSADCRSRVAYTGDDPTKSVTVPMVTLSSLIDQSGFDRIDLFSLDVEGFEVEVLRGLDLARHRPTYIVVETDDLDSVRQELAPYYALVTRLSHHDYLLNSREDVSSVCPEAKEMRAGWR